MNSEQAKEILKRYRPGTDDAEEPEVREALSVAEADPALRDWLAAYLESQQTVSDAFKSIRPPAGLKQQILAERPRRTPSPSRRRVATVLAAVAALIVIVVGVQFLSSLHGPALERYRTRMAKTALRMYAMDLETNDTNQVRAFLQQRGAPSDFRVPDKLRQAALVGCGSLTFDGHPVSLICFASGNPLPAGAKSDLWLFVADNKTLSNPDLSSTPTMQQAGAASTAAWSEGSKIYLLVCSGNETQLRKFL